MSKYPIIQLRSDNGDHIIIEAIEGTTLWNGGAYAEVYYFKNGKPTSDKKKADVIIYCELDKNGKELFSKRSYL